MYPRAVQYGARWLYSPKRTRLSIFVVPDTLPEQYLTAPGFADNVPCCALGDSSRRDDFNVPAAIGHVCSQIGHAINREPFPARSVHTVESQRD